MKTAPHHDTYKSSPERDEKLRFCVAVLEKILEIPGSPELKEELFRSIVWLVSEIDGKYTTRFRSRAALEAPAGSVQHEHVVPMRKLWEIVVQKCMGPAQLLPLVAACVVTRDEHRKLTAYDRSSDGQFGWMRYSQCQIPVVDMLEKHDVTMDEFKQMNAPLAEAFRATRGM
jgi:hypothetical protein